MKISRRSALLMMTGGLFGGVGRAVEPATRRPVVVLTAYPEEVTSRFETAFEKTHPQYRLQFVWRMPHDALPYLQAPAQNGVDVYWSASPRTYAALKRLNALRPMELDRSGLPTRIGGTVISDPDGMYLAAEVAGYGFAYNPQRLSALGLAVPTDWTDLARAPWFGQIVLPIPSRVGYAPVMIDIVLQAFGWDRGWALWNAVAAQSLLVGNGSTFVTDEVASGRRALGLTIDFFAASAVASGAPLRFGYPQHGGVNPAHIAITSQAPNPEGATAFARFVLSQQGQSLLTHSSIRKLPIRPSVYEHLPHDYFNPFEAARQGGLAYDDVKNQGQLGLTSALFEQALVVDHAECADLWRRLHAAEAAGRPNAAAARVLLEAAPVDAATGADAALAARFQRLEGSTAVAAAGLEQAWRDAATERRRQAAALLA